MPIPSFSRRFCLVALAAVFISACGSDEPGASGETVADATPATASVEERRPAPEANDASPCEMLAEAGLADLVGVAASAITFEPGGSTHPYCSATWEKPGAEALRAEHEEAIAAWGQRRIEAMANREEFDERMPMLSTNNSVMLTVAGRTWASDAEAATALEGLVGQLAEGITVETEQAQVTFKSDYDAWLADVGARAAWSNRNNKVSAVGNGHMVHVDVRLDDFAGGRPPEDAADAVAAVNRPVASELARRVLAQF